MIRTVLILALLAVLLAGCSNTNTCGGVTKKEAIAAARDGIALQANVEGTAVPKTIVADVKKSYDEKAKHDAWWVVLEYKSGYLSGSPVCFFVGKDSEVGLEVHTRPCS